MNRTHIFNAGDWKLTANGVWEAQATSPDLDGRPPFEATCRTYPTVEGWEWTLFRPPDNTASSGLSPSCHGQALTLADAQRQAEHAARRWRDQPKTVEAEARLKRYSDYSVVTCDSCGASHRLSQLLLDDSYCDTQLSDGSSCSSTHFDGFNTDELAEAVTQ